MVRGQPSRYRCGLPRGGGLRSKFAGRLDDGRVGGLSLVGGHEIAIGVGEVVSSDHGLCPLAEQLGAVRLQACGQLIELLDEFVVELNEDLTSRHVAYANTYG